MAVVLVCVGHETYYYFGSWNYHLENRYFEVGQNVFLLASVAIFAGTAWRETDRLNKSVLWGAALFCFSLLVREFDVRETRLEPYLGVAYQYRVQYFLLVVLASTWVFRVYGEIGPTWRKGLLWIRSLPGMWFSAAIILYIVSDLTEKSLSNSDFNLAMMLEESAEIFGTVFLVYAGYVSLRRQVCLTISQRTLSPDDGR